MKHLYKKLKAIVVNLNEYKQDVFSLDKNSCHPNLINGLNQTIFEINELGQWIYLNAQWEKLTGFSVIETLNTDLIHHVHPDDKKQCADFIQSIYNNAPISFSRRIRFLTKDSHFCWVNMRANKFTNPIDNKTHLIGVISDITDRVREYGLHQANYRTLHTLINNLCGLVYRGRNDRDWTMEFVSEGCLELTGYRPSELINQTVTFGSLINPNDQDLVWTNVQSALRENRFYELNYRIRTSNGTEKWVWERGKGNFSSSSELLSIEGLIVDITDYKRNKLKENEEILYKTKIKLPQKYLFLDRLNIAIARTTTVPNYKFTLLIIHIDRFEKFQDLFPADFIDQIIIDISKRINSVIDPTISFCLFGDGEFALLLEHTESIEYVRALIKNIHDVLLTPIKIDNVDTFITVSIGIYLSTDTMNDRESVINNTYTALNRAKSLGRSRYEIFDETTNARVYALERMEKEILYAIENNELSICYQPISDKENNKNSIFEAQLFWNHPRRGKISSNIFSPIKENKEIVSLLNRWIIDSVINQMKIWESQTVIGKKLDINICFFGHQIFTDDFLSNIEQKLSSVTYSKIKFSINIPEHNLHLLSKKQTEILNKLNNKKDIGLNIEIDKSTLPSTESLLFLPISLIKINTLLATGNDRDQQLANAQINYIHALGKKFVINGVNTEEELNAINALDFDYIQGDIISPALKSEDLIQFLTSQDKNKPISNNE